MVEQFNFADLRELLAKANEEKSGDQLAGIAARSEQERVAAKRRLADVTLDEIVRQPLIDPDKGDSRSGFVSGRAFRHAVKIAQFNGFSRGWCAADFRLCLPSQPEPRVNPLAVRVI